MPSSPSPTASPSSPALEEISSSATAADAVSNDLPLTMAASVVLDHLPRDAHRALETAGELELAKGELMVPLLSL